MPTAQLVGESMPGEAGETKLAEKAITTCHNLELAFPAKEMSTSMCRVLDKS